MQVVRQCSACASRAAQGFLQNHTDISLLRTSNSVLRGGAACIRIRRLVMNFGQCYSIDVENSLDLGCQVLLIGIDLKDHWSSL